MLAGGQADDEVREQQRARLRREPRFLDDAAPGDIARVPGQRIRPELGANAGAHAVGADQQVGLDARAVREVRQHPALARLDAREGSAGEIALLREGAAQRAIEMPPGRLDLRLAAAGEDASAGVERDALLEPDAERIVERQPEALERGVKLRVGGDADAAFGELGADALVHRHVAAGAVQHVAGEQAAERAADDDHAQALRGLSSGTICHGARLRSGD